MASATEAERRESREAPEARQPKRSGGNPEKRQRRDVGRGATLVVAAALYGRDGRILIAQRPPGKHMAGRWEFPGGKVDTGESEAMALARELQEELGIQVTSSHPFMRLAHSYNDRDVELSMWIVDSYLGEPQSLDGQGLKWVEPALLGAEDILEADKPFVEALQKRACTMNPISQLQLD